MILPSDSPISESVDAMLQTPLDWALFYVSKGWSVLPIWWVEDGHCACADPNCRSPGKHPIGHLAPNGMKSASNDKDVITQWSVAAPHMNIAIATGAVSNLIVLDLDVKELEDEYIDGSYELKTWLAGRGIDFPDSLVQETGGGGWHILLGWPVTAGPRPAIASRANWLPGVDIRADGGYIVAAPSQHISGKFYHWQDGHVLSVVSNDLLNVLATEKRQTPGQPLSPASQSIDVNRLINEGFRFGERDDGFTRLAGVLRGRGDSLDTAKAIVSLVWEKTDQSEKDFYELAVAVEKLERGWRMWDPPEELSEGEMKWALRTDVRAQAIEALKTGAPLLTQKKGSQKTIDPIVTSTRGQERSTESHGNPTDDGEDEEDEEEDRDPTSALDVAELMDGGALERELPTMLRRTDGRFLVYPGRLHSIYGEPGHGKTWVALHLLREQLQVGNSVVYLDYDEDDAGKSMALRLRSLGVASSLVREGLHYLNPQGMGRDSTMWTKLKQQIRAWKPTVVVVDTMAPALVELGLSEKDNTEVGQWYSHARWLLRGLKPQAALVIIDHVVKSGEGRGRWARGAGDKLGRLHTAYGVESEVPFDRTAPGFIRLIVAKDRAGEVGRESDIAAVVKFNPGDDGNSLEIIIDIAGSADMTLLARQNAHRASAVNERVFGALSQVGPEGMAPTALRRAMRIGPDEANIVLRSMVDENIINTIGEGHSLRYVLPN